LKSKRSVRSRVAVLPALLWGAIVAGSACTPEEYLFDGSLTEICDLKYERTELELASASAALRFLRPRGTGEDLMLKIGIVLTGADLSGTKPLDLAEALPAGGQRASVTRNVFEDENKKFPAILRGTLTVDADPRSVNPVTGSVEITFVQGHEFGAGRTLFGKFKAEVVK
jgi:hypothetical protein